MRLSESEIKIIKKAFRKNFDPNDHLWLFGSRIDNNKKGGDIDLYIETLEPNLELGYAKKIKFMMDLEIGLGEQKIDIVINFLTLNKPDEKILIFELARKTGVLLS